MNIVLLLSNEFKQHYVIRELARLHKILGVVIEDKYTGPYRLKMVLKMASYNPFKIAGILYRKIKFSGYEARNKKIIEGYFFENGSPIPIDKSIPVVTALSVNSPEVVERIRGLSPDLIIVFGVSLVKKKIMEIPKIGIINVHTGLSPYYRGGQSAFWCLYNNEPEYIGVTIHWLDKGIDSGDIILQTRPRIEEGDNLCSIECKLAVLAVELLIKVVDKIKNGSAKKIKQEIQGRFYFSKQFTLDKRLQLEKMLKKGLLKKYLSRKDSVYGKVKIVDD